MAVNKAKFNELLTKDGATIKINDIFTLYRWQTTATGLKVDNLQIICNNPIGAKCDFDYYIKARNFSDFLEDFSEIVKKYFLRLAEEESKKALNNRFKFGDIF